MGNSYGVKDETPTNPQFYWGYEKDLIITL
jgi:hypothetical protein